MIHEKYSIVCNVDCLLKIFEEYDNRRLGSENPYDLLLVTQFYNLFTTNAYLVLDKKIEDMQKNPYIKKLLKESKTRGKVLLEENRHDLFEEKSYPSLSANTMFIMNKSKEECQKLEEDYGMYFISIDNIFERAKLLFSWALYNVTRNEKASNKFKNWEELQNFRHPFNAMVLVDNYILQEKDNYKGIDNLIDLLDNFLPNELQKLDFHLTIIIKKDEKNLKSKCKKLTEMINNLKRPYKIVISLISVSSDKNHDRNIFTNYFWLHSGHGFDYFSKKGDVTNPTNLMIFPIFHQQDKISPQQNTVYEAVYQLLSEVKSIFDNAIFKAERTPTKVLEQNACGNKQNRLLS